MKLGKVFVQRADDAAVPLVLGLMVQAADDVHLDVLAAIRYLRESGAHTVSVIGASFGGGAAAEASTHASAAPVIAASLMPAPASFSQLAPRR